MNRKRLKELLAEYGKLALYVYLVIFGLVLAGFALAISMGIRVESAAGKAGVWGAAWLATKVTQPLRILATLALTPLVARLLRRPGRTVGGDPPPPPANA
jgi:hypothetical protein